MPWSPPVPHHDGPVLASVRQYMRLLDVEETAMQRDIRRCAQVTFHLNIITLMFNMFETPALTCNLLQAFY